MEMSGPVRKMIARSSLVLLMVLLSGCAALLPTPTEPVVISEPDPLPLPEPIIDPVPEPPPPIVVVPEPDEPEPLQNIEPLVAVVISDRTSAYVDLSSALGQYLDRQHVYDLGDRSLSPEQAFDVIADSGAVAVVAIGMGAAEAASRYSSLPVIVGQVFNVSHNELLGADRKAIAALPPIELQIDAWQEIDPSIRDVGAILGPGHEDLIAETDLAMRERGIKFHYAIAKTDRETLYLFNRMVRDIDGYILFPDNRILSRTVLSDMMGDALRHRVQVAVFNDPLLDHGAAFSASPVYSDMAATVARLLDQVLDGNIGSLPPITRLNDILIRTNPEILRRFGLEVSAPDAGSAVADNQ